MRRVKASAEKGHFSQKRRGRQECGKAHLGLDEIGDLQCFMASTSIIV